LTALHAGVPQLVLSQFDDQFDNADAVVKAGAGVRLLQEEITPSAVARTCADLLADPTFGESAVSIAAEIADQPSPAVTVSDLEALAR